MPIIQVLMAIVSGLRASIRRLMIALRRCTASTKVWVIELKALMKITQACLPSPYGDSLSRPHCPSSPSR